MHASSGFAMGYLRFQRQPHVNTPDHEYVLLQLNLAHRLTHQTSGGCIDLTRLQRAPVGSRKSTRRRGDNVIERGCSRIGNRRRYLVMLCDGAMDAKDHRLRFSRKIGFTNRSFDALDSNFGAVDNFRHQSSNRFQTIVSRRRSLRRLELESLPFGNQNNRRTTGRDFRRVGKRFLAAGGVSALLKRFHGREMNFNDPVKLWLALGRLQHFVGDDLRLAGEFVYRHRNVLFLIRRFESFYVLGLWIGHN